MRILTAGAAGLLLSAAGLAWHDPVHELITRNALGSLPARMQQKWAPFADRLAREYSLYPDRIHGAKEPELSRLRLYCVKPDGKPIHNITWEPEDDVKSLAYSLHGIIEAMRGGRIDVATQHAGVLAHFLEDSTCPAHALIPADSPLHSMRDRLAPPEQREIQLHPAIERSAPAFDLAGRAPQRAGSSVPQAAEALLERCYVIVRHNRENLETLVKAVYAGDSATVDRMRLEAARRGAELLADAYYTAFLLAEEKRGQANFSRP
jgi:hypothetical protein